MVTCAMKWYADAHSTTTTPNLNIFIKQTNVHRESTALLTTQMAYGKPKWNITMFSTQPEFLSVGPIAKI
jgi:hypothetical protein